MAHPIFSVIVRRPDLLARHLSNHAELIGAEFAQAKRALVRKAVAGLGAGVSLLLALGLSATAVMLAVVERFHWALIAVPGLVWLTHLLCLRRNRRPRDGPAKSRGGPGTNRSRPRPASPCANGGSE